MEGKQNPESRIQSSASLGPRKQEKIQNSEFEVVLGRVRLGEDTIQNPESEKLPREQRAKTKIQNTELDTSLERERKENKDIRQNTKFRQGKER